MTPKQRELLEHQLKTTQDAHVFQRSLAVLEYDQGSPISQLARLLRVDRRSVHRWINRYGETHDPKCLWDDERPGRPPRWTEDCSAWLQALLKKSLNEFEFFAVNWTVPLLQEQLEHCRGERFSQDTIRRALRRLGYVWKRPRYVLEPDPEREKKNVKSAEKSGNWGLEV